MRTLRNAVELGRVHHAYLFVGSRGTGKTSMAKILAACLNCEHGPTMEPCGTCESCRSIAQARSLDVIEMDAASNNSVEDIRELREGVAFAPVSGRSKVYILDEAHMLSTAAWNAFLKTLEEPPPNTVFVLATTEAQKVPATVVDRCHRFDFQRPTVEQIAGVLQRAAQAESIAIPPEAVAALARAATGSFRDALGLLEQLVTYSGSEIALADVLAVLGVTDSELLDEAIEAVHSGDARAALLAVAHCTERGRDAATFAADLEVRARELLLVATLGEVPSELSLTADGDARLQAQAERVGEGTAVRLLDQLGAALEATKAGADPRTQLELALVKAARPAVDGSLGALLARLERLERGAVPVAVAPAPAAPPAGAHAGPPTAQAPPGGAQAAPPAAQTAPPAAPAPSTAAPAAPPTGAHAEPPAAPAAPAPVAPTPGAPTAAAPTPPAAQPPSSAAPEASIAPAAPSAAAAGAPLAVDPPAPSASPAGGSDNANHVHNTLGENTPNPPSPSPSTPPDIDALLALWPAVLELVGSRNALLSAVLAPARPVALHEGELRVAFPATATFPKKKAEDSAHRATVTEALRELTGDARLRVEYELRDELPGAEDEQPAPRSEEEWVARIKDELDAEELPVERVLAGGAGEAPPDYPTASGE